MLACKSPTTFLLLPRLPLCLSTTLYSVLSLFRHSVVYLSPSLPLLFYLTLPDCQLSLFAFYLSHFALYLSTSYLLLSLCCILSLPYLYLYFSDL